MSASLLRALAVIEVLSGHEISGLRLKEVVDELGLSVAATTILRDLETLQSASWARQSKEGRWTLGSRPYQLLHHFYDGLKAVQERAAEVSANYTRLPN